MSVIAEELLSLLDNLNEIQYRNFFSGAGQLTDIPKRCAYYVGLKVAEHAAKTRTLQELASLQRNEIRGVVEEGLRFLANLKHLQRRTDCDFGCIPFG